jgi:hypothetical protein
MHSTTTRGGLPAATLTAVAEQVDRVLSGKLQARMSYTDGLLFRLQQFEQQMAEATTGIEDGKSRLHEVELSLASTFDSHEEDTDILLGRLTKLEKEHQILESRLIGESSVQRTLRAEMTLLREEVLRPRSGRDRSDRLAPARAAEHSTLGLSLAASESGAYALGRGGAELVVDATRLPEQLERLAILEGQMVVVQRKVNRRRKVRVRRLRPARPRCQPKAAPEPASEPSAEPVGEETAAERQLREDLRAELDALYAQQQAQQAAQVPPPHQAAPRRAAAADDGGRRAQEEAQAAVVELARRAGEDGELAADLDRLWAEQRAAAAAITGLRDAGGGRRAGAAGAQSLDRLVERMQVMPPRGPARHRGPPLTLATPQGLEELQAGVRGPKEDSGSEGSAAGGGRGDRLGRIRRCEVGLRRMLDWYAARRPPAAPAAS